jgi:hypothetical protein
MAKTDQPPLAWFVHLIDEYGQARLVATVVIEKSVDELRTVPSWSGGVASGAQFCGLEVIAYVGGSADLSATGIWASRVRYAPHDIDTARQARAIAAVLARIERGLDRLSAAEGHLDHGDYAGYLIRVGRILKISRFHVRASRQRRDSNGQEHYPTDGSGLRNWVEQTGNDVMAGNRHEHLPGGRLHVRGGPR